MKVIVHTEPNAEDNAALQAWYSRSAAGVEAHREKLAREGSGKFMDRIFIQYGHASVGDLGYTTVYFEGISMLAAKAIQDNPLYNGQECSSRYIDFSEQPFYAPDNDAYVRALHARMREFYTQSLGPVKASLRDKYPRQQTEHEVTYEKAIAARAFDILRGFLPCGATTNVAWSGTLRNFKERLELLMHHPLAEVQSLSHTAYTDLYKAYPHSFRQDYAESKPGDLQGIEPADVYRHLSDLSQFYSDVLLTSDRPAIFEPEEMEPYIEVRGTFDRRGRLYRFAHPRGYAPARHNNVVNRRCHQYVLVAGMLDFGSFRDLQRHRNGYCSMPVVDSYEGVHPWYLQQLPEDLQRQALELIKDVDWLDDRLMSAAGGGVETLTLQRVENQYFMPMGMQVPFTLNYGLPQAIYVAELRSSKTVHPTLRRVAQCLARCLEQHQVEVHYDSGVDDWTVRRGAQDIVEVDNVS